jgi:hypothetical protein
MAGELILELIDLSFITKPCSKLVPSWMRKRKIMFDDSHSSNIVGVGVVLIKFTFEKEVTLNYMLHE